MGFCHHKDSLLFFLFIGFNQPLLNEELKVFKVPFVGAPICPLPRCRWISLFAGALAPQSSPAAQTSGSPATDWTSLNVGVPRPELLSIQMDFCPRSFHLAPESLSLFLILFLFFRKAHRSPSRFMGYVPNSSLGLSARWTSKLPTLPGHYPQPRMLCREQASLNILWWVLTIFFPVRHFRDNIH